MSAIQQYLDLYREHHALIERNSAPCFTPLREEAAAVLAAKPLPKAGSENYEHTDLSTLLAPDYGINIAKVPMDVKPAYSFHCGVPMMSTALLLNLNDTWCMPEETAQRVPEGVEVCSLRQKALEAPEEVMKYLGKIADMGNPLVALNTLLMEDGMWLKVKKGVRIELPLQLVNILQSNMPLMALRRIVVVMEEDSEAKLLVCDHTQNPDMDFLSLQTIEIFAGRNSHFDLYDLEESSDRTVRLSTLWLHQEEGSQVLLDGITLYNGHTRNEYHTLFKGEHASLKLLGLGIEDCSRVLDNYTYVDHRVGHCLTDELFKYVVDDKARGAFTGRIYVAEGAEKTEAYQNNRNIVGSAEAQMYSKPQLEIYNDDVKCSHGSAVGQLDEKQVFYMRSRGLDETEARLLLKQAFMSDVIDGVRLPALRERLVHLVERRFAGETGRCAGCGATCHTCK